MNEFKHGWSVLVTAISCTLCALLTVTNYSQGFFIDLVSEEFDWTPLEFFVGFALMIVMGLGTASLIAALAKRISLQKIVIIGLTGHALGYSLLAQNNGNIVIWWLTWGMLSSLAASSLAIVWTAGLRVHFVKHRVKATVITVLVTAIGGFFLPPMIETLIVAEGWQVAYQNIGTGAAVLSLPIVFFPSGETAVREPSQSARAGDMAPWCHIDADLMRRLKLCMLLIILCISIILMTGLLSDVGSSAVSDGFGRIR